MTVQCVMVFLVCTTLKANQIPLWVTNFRIIFASNPMKTVVNLQGYDCDECQYNDSFTNKSTLYVRAYKMREKFSNTVVVPRVIASKCAELVAVAIDTPVVDKP